MTLKIFWANNVRNNTFKKQNTAQFPKDKKRSCHLYRRDVTDFDGPNLGVWLMDYKW
jgi:hypothetical protein